MAEFSLAAGVTFAAGCLAFAGAYIVGTLRDQRAHARRLGTVRRRLIAAARIAADVRAMTGLTPSQRFVLSAINLHAQIRDCYGRGYLPLDRTPQGWPIVHVYTTGRVLVVDDAGTVRVIA